MTLNEARVQIEAVIQRYGDHAQAALDRIVRQIASEHGSEQSNALIHEFDLELCYNISPTEFESD